ncbi:MAG: N-acetylmuramoyl-L-alanine amidase [Chthoniobacterales bacterium]|nr:N-acetylmuramoyl-L-alanine amidase [Chthoniobacterales bacterium]
MKRLPSSLAALSLAAVFLLSGCATVATNTSRTFETVVVDAGHGGKDSGAWRRHGPPEKAVALDVALRVDRKLRESQLKTVLTRANDTFIPLDSRVALGNQQKNSIFVSIHFNDSRRRAVGGIETYYYSPYAFHLASRIERGLATLPGTVTLGVHTARFRVLRNAQYPSVLVECGYLSNRSNARDAADSDYREKLADKIAEAIVDYRFGDGVYRRKPAVVARAGGGPFSFLPSFR